MEPQGSLRQLLCARRPRRLHQRMQAPKERLCASKSNPAVGINTCYTGLRDVEDLLAERGVIVSYESIRVWCQWLGTQIAAKIRLDRPVPADKWHLDAVVISIRGRKHWLWRAVGANGDVLEILMQSRRNAHAAKRFLMKLMKRWGVPRALVTDKLRSYGVARPSVDHRSHKGLNNRSEASNRHTRRRKTISLMVSDVSTCGTELRI